MTLLLNPYKFTATAPPPGGFSPDDISGLGIWLDSNDLSATHSDMDPVPTWNNKADTETFSAGSATNPTFDAVSLNGLPGVVFDGTHWMQGTVSRAMKPVTVFAVVTVGSSTGVRNLMGGSASGGLAWRLFQGTDAAMDLLSDHSALLGVNHRSAQTGLSVVLDVSYGVSGEFKFGEQGTRGRVATNDRAITAGAHVLGAAQDKDDDIDATFHEFLVYDSALSDSDRDLVNQYLLDKWGLPIRSVSLPHTETFATPAYDGLFDWMGTNGGTQAFENPAGAFVDWIYGASQSSENNTSRTADNASAHANGSISETVVTENSPGQWWQADFGPDARVEVDHYAIQGWDASSNHLRNWKLQGSQDGISWTDLDTQESNTDIGNDAWFDGPVANATAWRYLRIFQTGLNSDGSDILTIGEIEFWGTIQEEPSSFDPIADIDWHSAYWADDPNWTDPGDGNALSGADAWDDAKGNGHHLSVNTGSPVFRESDPDFGGRSVIDFDGASDMVSDVFADQGAEIEYFVVAKLDADTGAYGYLHGTTGHRVGFGGGSGNAYRLFQGSQADGGTQDTDVHTFNARFAATDELWVDGTQEISGDAGSETLEQIRMATFSADGGSSYLDGKIAFAAIKIGALTAQERTDLEAWAQEYYSPSFSPLSIDWFSAYWADDPNWTNPGDGNNLVGADAWTDATGNGHHLSVNNGSPVFRASDADFGNRSVVDFVNTDMVTDIFADQGNEVEYFVVAKSDQAGGLDDGGFLHGTTGHRVGFGYFDGEWQIFQGSGIRDVTMDTNVHTFNARFTATDQLFIDGTQTLSGDAGTETLEQIRMGSFSAAGGLPQLDGRIAFAAVKIGSLTAQERTDLEAWATEYYGL